MTIYAPDIYDSLPIQLESGQGCFVQTNQGISYFDCLAGYSALSFGHCHPTLVAALTKQAAKLALTSRAFKADVTEQWEEKICATFSATHVIPMTSGAEAVEVAIKCARRWGNRVKGIPDGQQLILVCDRNFHGRTTTIISFSSYKNYKDGFGPLTPGFLNIPFNDLEALSGMVETFPNIVAMLVEPIQGEGGMHVPSETYFTKVRTMLDKHNILLILDEVQTGLGRTGYMLAEELYGVRSDITCLGKALGGGLLPISATLARRKDIMRLLGKSDHGSTWGGNPLACAVSLAVLNLLQSEPFCDNARAMGSFIKEELRSYGLLVRGEGLMLGIVLPPGRSRDFCLDLLKYKILVRDSHGVVRVTPPLSITIKLARDFVNAVQQVVLQDPSYITGGHE